jgi:hypothetical protein
VKYSIDSSHQNTPTRRASGFEQKDWDCAKSRMMMMKNEEESPRQMGQQQQQWSHQYWHQEQQQQQEWTIKFIY